MTVNAVDAMATRGNRRVQTEVMRVQRANATEGNGEKGNGKRFTSMCVAWRMIIVFAQLESKMEIEPPLLMCNR
eukprot:131408-Hanusia_phi.AAC.3